MDKKTLKKSNFTKLQHVGVVVKDIKKAITYLESLGIGPFTAPGTKPGSLPVFTIPFKGELHGKPAAWKTTITFARMGDVELEILEPTEGPQALKESLDKTGEGLHHLGFLTDDLDAEIANFKKAAVTRSIGVINMEEVPEPETGADQIKVKIAYCGLCGTDPENLEGRFGLVPPEAYKQPRVIGHEASGPIAEVGQNIKTYKVGQRVAMNFGSSCGACYYCRNKMEHFCRRRIPAAGSFAEYAVYPESAMYVLPDDISLEIGALLEA